jgi:hypothetical protein
MRSPSASELSGFRPGWEFAAKQKGMKKNIMPLNGSLNEGNGFSNPKLLATLSTSPAPYTPYDLRQAPVTGNGKEMLT